MVLPDTADLDRRRLLCALAGLSVASALGGRALLLRPDAAPVCPTDPQVRWLDGELTIDAHCHVFNGSDLQIKEFLTRVAGRLPGIEGAGARVVAPLVRDLSLAAAPSGDDEHTMLRALSAARANCTSNAVASALQAKKQVSHTNGLTALRAAAERSRFDLDSMAADERRPEESQATQRALSNYLDRLPDNVDEYGALRADRSRVSIESIGVQQAEGVIEFLLRAFQYRYVNVTDYLKLYNRPGDRVVDLMVPAVVDYDYALAKGLPTRTSLRSQMMVMREIAIITGGRVHALFPFDPMRQVAFERGRAREDSLGLVKEAVRQNGALGVKLYPPMGFAALGNAGLPKAPWTKHWLPGWMSDRRMGQWLDDALRELYRWCVDEGVPVMAHTSLSNGASDDLQNLAGSEGWCHALDEFKSLRVSFGHFGDSEPALPHDIARAQGFTKLMSTGATERGFRAYADAGYFVDVVDREPALQTLVAELYDDIGHTNGAPLAERFMYGTDWEMTIQHGHIRSYLGDWVHLMSWLQERPAVKSLTPSRVRENFFGLNAATWAGLRRGDAGRDRLETFYSATRVDVPDWMAKLDRP